MVCYSGCKIGKRTIGLENRPSILSYGSIVGKKEHEGPIGHEFDQFITDSFFGQKSFEKAESQLQKTAVETALKKANLSDARDDEIRRLEVISYSEKMTNEKVIVEVPDTLTKQPYKVYIISLAIALIGVCILLYGDQKKR